MSSTQSHEETIEAPFPYTIKAFPDGSALFTLYSPQSPGARVCRTGKIDAVPVGGTTVIR